MVSLHAQARFKSTEAGQRNGEHDISRGAEKNSADRKKEAHRVVLPYI